MQPSMQRHSLYFPDIFNDRLDLLIAVIKLGGGSMVTTVRRTDLSILVEYDSDTNHNVQWAIQPLFASFYRDVHLDDYPVGQTWSIDQVDWRIINAFKTGPIENPHVAVVLREQNSTFESIMHFEGGRWHVFGAAVYYTMHTVGDTKVLSNEE